MQSFSHKYDDVIHIHRSLNVFFPSSKFMEWLLYFFFCCCCFSDGVLPHDQVLYEKNRSRVTAGDRLWQSACAGTPPAGFTWRPREKQGFRRFQEGYQWRSGILCYTKVNFINMQGNIFRQKLCRSSSAFKKRHEHTEIQAPPINHVLRSLLIGVAVISG